MASSTSVLHLDSDATAPSLADLEILPYLTPEGTIPAAMEGQVGIYAVFDEARTLHYVGYSRDVALSLKQHLVRRPQACHWVKVVTISRPNRTQLEGIRDAWIAANGTVPPGNGADAALWTQPIDTKLAMTADEKAAFAASDDLGQIKLLKKVARRIEADILEILQARGVQMDLRFNPKLKESGLLDLK